MITVKLHPNCFTRHRAPRVPWYINEDCTGLNEGLENVEWLVTEDKNNRDLFVVNGFYLDGALMRYKLRSVIQNKDCVGYNKLL